MIPPSDLPLTTSVARRRIIARTVMVAVYSVAILVLGLMRAGAIPQVAFNASDKVMHALVFGGLAVLVYRLSCLLGPRLKNTLHAMIGVVFATGFGVLLEILQMFTSYRSAEFADAIADFLGASLCVGIAVVFRLERPSRLLSL